MLAALLAISLQVITPSDGATLRGGQFTALTWSADRLPNGAEEWEAFLSLDGGRYYAVRLTPHLDVRIRRFQVLIPNVESDDVRLLIRAGDERHETVLEMPQRLKIRAEAPSLARVRDVAGSGESARPDEPPVVMWSVGDSIERSAAPASLASCVAQKSSHRVIALTSMRVHTELRANRFNRTLRPPLAARRTSAVDVLLRTSRLNV